MSEPVAKDDKVRAEIAAVLVRATVAESIAAENGLLMLAGQIASMRWGLELLASERWPAPEKTPPETPAVAPGDAVTPPTPDSLQEN